MKASIPSSNIWLEENFPISRGTQNPLDVIPSYMTSTNQVPIMTQSDSVLQFGPNAYSKPAASLIVLRETVMGRELFDFAFREYATRWKFKRPTPADFFRTMEDASAVDLDWFWRGWYYGTDHVDMAVTGVREYQISTNDPEIEKDIEREEYQRNRPENISQIRNREEGMKTRLKRYSDLEDFYNENDKFTVTNADRNRFKKFYDGLEDWERKAYDRAMEDGKYLYFVDFENIGGLISPLPVTIEFENGSTEDMMIPAEIWRRNSEKVTKLFSLNSRAVGFKLDVQHQTADADFSNNSYPQTIAQSRIDLYKSNRSSSSMMADMLRELHSEKSDSEAMDSKSVPMGEAEESEPEMTEMQKEGETTSDAQTPDEKTSETKSTDKKTDEKESKKSSLRRTLERMLERK